MQDSPVKFNTTSDVLTVGRDLVEQLPIRGRNPYNISTLDPTINSGENNNGGVPITTPSPMNSTRWRNLPRQ